MLEGLVVNKHRPKHNFTVRDLTRGLLALWTYDDLVFIHERFIGYKPRSSFTSIVGRAPGSVRSSQMVCDTRYIHG